MSVRKLLIRYEGYLKAEGVSPGSSPTICIFGIGWHKYVVPGHKTVDMNTGLLSHHQPKV